MGSVMVRECPFLQVSDNIFKFRFTKIAMEGNAPRGTLLFRKGEI